MFIHGGGASGACFRATPDGRLGWGELLAADGVECWLTDWPGGGRSGGRDQLRVDYDDLIEGYAALLRERIARPTIILCHSMGGAIAWKLVERHRPLVAAIAAIAASYPGNIGPTSSLLSDDGIEVRARFAASGAEFTVRRDQAYRYDDTYINRQALAGSTRFPRALVPALEAALVAIPPKLVLARLGLDGGLPTVHDTSAFEGLKVRFFAGTEDPAHTREIDGGTADLLRSWGADSELVWLGDHGIVGNGHFLFYEENSDEIFRLIRSQLA